MFFLIDDNLLSRLIQIQNIFQFWVGIILLMSNIDSNKSIPLSQFSKWIISFIIGYKNY